MSATPIIGVVLAGGQSRRMGGGDKCLLPLAGRPMIAQVIERLDPQCSNLIINANGPEERFEQFGLPIVPDLTGDFAGPLAGVLTGMRWVQKHQPDARHIVTAASDTPFFPTDLVQQLCQKGDQAIVLAESLGKTHPVFGLWPVHLADDLGEWLSNPNNRKILAWVDRHPNHAVPFDKVSMAGQMVDPFANINTPEQLAKADALAKGT